MGSYRFNEAFAARFWDLIQQIKDSVLSQWRFEYDTVNRAETVRQVTTHVETGFEEAKKQIRASLEGDNASKMAIRVPKIHGKYDNVGISRGLFHVSRYCFPRVVSLMGVLTSSAPRSSKS